MPSAAAAARHGADGTAETRGRHSLVYWRGAREPIERRRVPRGGLEGRKRFSVTRLQLGRERELVMPSSPRAAAGGVETREGEMRVEAPLTSILECGS